METFQHAGSFSPMLTGGTRVKVRWTRLHSGHGKIRLSFPYAEVHVSVRSNVDISQGEGTVGIGYKGIHAPLYDEPSGFRCMHTSWQRSVTEENRVPITGGKLGIVPAITRWATWADIDHGSQVS